MDNDIHGDGLSRNDSDAELFRNVGKQVEDLSLEPGEVSSEGLEDGHDAADNLKIVEEIESLCMNCHEDVRALQIPITVEPFPA